MGEEIKICGLCQQEIDTSRDNYCVLTDYKSGQFYMEGYYHTQCYNDTLNLKKQKMLGSFKQLLQSVKFSPSPNNTY